jgi:hypothetical protein
MGAVMRCGAEGVEDFWIGLFALPRAQSRKSGVEIFVTGQLNPALPHRWAQHSPG